MIPLWYKLGKKYYPLTMEDAKKFKLCNGVGQGMGMFDSGKFKYAYNGSNDPGRFILREENMIPIWVKNPEGKWELFPTHILETFSDGKRGLVNHRMDITHQICTDFNKWSHLFSYDAKNYRYVLIQDLETKPE